MSGERKWRPSAPWTERTSAALPLTCSSWTKTFVTTASGTSVECLRSIAFVDSLALSSTFSLDNINYDIMSIKLTSIDTEIQRFHLDCVLRKVGIWSRGGDSPQQLK